MGSFTSKNNDISEGYVNTCVEYIPEEYFTFVQIVRKNVLLKQYKEYINNTNQYSIYHKHFVNTKEIESIDGIVREYCIRSTVFFTLWRINTTQYENDEDVIEWVI